MSREFLKLKKREMLSTLSFLSILKFSKTNNLRVKTLRITTKNRYRS